MHFSVSWFLTLLEDTRYSCKTLHVKQTLKHVSYHLSADITAYGNIVNFAETLFYVVTGSLVPTSNFASYFFFFFFFALLFSIWSFRTLFCHFVPVFMYSSELYRSLRTNILYPLSYFATSSVTSFPCHFLSILQRLRIDLGTKWFLLGNHLWLFGAKGNQLFDTYVLLKIGQYYILGQKGNGSGAT